MRVLVIPMRHLGKARPKREIETAEPARGDLIVGEEKSDTFSRYSNIARFQLSGASDQQPLPPLHNAALSWLGPNGFVLTGIDLVDGVTYTQPWWRREYGKSKTRVTGYGSD